MVFVCHTCESREVGDLHLRVGDYFHEDAASVVVYGLLYFFHVGEVGRVEAYTELPQRTVEQIKGVAKHVC